MGNTPLKNPLASMTGAILYLGRIAVGKIPEAIPSLSKPLQVAPLNIKKDRNISATVCIAWAFSAFIGRPVKACIKSPNCKLFFTGFFTEFYFLISFFILNINFVLSRDFLYAEQKLS